MNKKITGFQVKYIALVTMLIDHFAFIFRWDLPIRWYYILRGIGRISFPLFAFILTESFFHTHSHKKFLFRLFLFSVISEIPFDRGLLGTWSTFSHQNVFFTLTIAYLAMMILEGIFPENQSYSAFALVLPIAAEYLRTDYGALGVLCVLAFYFVAKRRHNMSALTEDNPVEPVSGQSLSSFSLPEILICMAVLLPMATRRSHYLEAYCLFAAPFAWLYNGEKGQGRKYFFYIFYPAHLLLLRLLHHVIYSSFL